MVALRAMLATALILNGMAMPPAAAMHGNGAVDTASHAGHHPPDSAPSDSHADHSAGLPGDDCCDGANCDCGCAVPQVGTPPVTVTRMALRAALLEFAFVMKTFHSSPLAAPFRPPA